MPAGKYLWTARGQLGTQVLPLIINLARSDNDWFNNPDLPDFCAIEGIASLCSFGMDSGQVRIYGQARLRVRLEALQLWMLGVAQGLATKYCLCKQCLTPKGNKAFWIQVHGVDRPEPHVMVPNA